MMKKLDKEELFNRQAARYNRRRKRKKTVDARWRQLMLSYAGKKILEVAVGAGANFPYYPKNAEITAVDQSEAMLENAKAAASEAGLHPSFIASTVESLDFAPESFDTIISTFSLCAYDDPEKVLRLFGRWCRKDGSILLLEHGVGKYDLVRWLQNRFDKFQYRKIGCHANRDILEIVKHSGLKIRMFERKLMGVIYMVWAKPEPAQSIAESMAPI